MLWTRPDSKHTFNTCLAYSWKQGGDNLYPLAHGDGKLVSVRAANPERVESRSFDAYSDQRQWGGVRDCDAAYLLRCRVGYGGLRGKQFSSVTTSPFATSTWTTYRANAQVSKQNIASTFFGTASLCATRFPSRTPCRRDHSGPRRAASREAVLSGSNVSALLTEIGVCLGFLRHNSQTLGTKDGGDGDCS